NSQTIRSSSNTSSVEYIVEKQHNDLRYQTLYSIVCNTSKFVNTLSRYERIIYDYRYREADLSVYEWEDLTVLLDEEAAKHNKSFSKSTTLRLRNRMLERYADKIDIHSCKNDTRHILEVHNNSIYNCIIEQNP